MTKLTVMLLSDYSLGNDFIHTKQNYQGKALTSIDGLPMILHPIKSLSQCKFISNIIVLSQRPEYFKHELADYSICKDVNFYQSKGGIAKSVLDTLEKYNIDFPVLITTAENCLLRCEHIEDFLNKALSYPSDIAIGYVQKNKVTSRHPLAKRSWIQFRDTDLTPTNLYLLIGEKSKEAVGFWKKLDNNSRNYLKMTWALGPAFFSHFKHRTLTVRESFYKISTSIGANVNPVFLSNPDIAITANNLINIQHIETIMHHRRDNQLKYKTLDSAKVQKSNWRTYASSPSG